VKGNMVAGAGGKLEVTGLYIEYVGCAPVGEADCTVPTFTVDAVCCYRRLTLVATRGRIGKVFFPVSSPARSAAQVIAWMKIRGIG